MKLHSLALALFAGPFAFATPEAATWHVLKKVPIAGEGGQDHLATSAGARSAPSGAFTDNSRDAG